MNFPGFIGPTYQSQSPSADAEMAMNWFAERMETEGAKARFVLYPTQGTKKRLTLADSPVRGQFEINGRWFAVGGGTFCEILQDYSTTHSNAVANDGGPVVFCAIASTLASPAQMVFCSAAHVYHFNLDTNAFSDITAQMLGSTFFVGSIDNFFFAVDAEGFQISAVNDGTTWDPTDVTSVTVIPDDLIGAAVDHRELFVWSRTRGVVYGDSGAEFPFDVISGSIMEAGLAAVSSPVRADNSLFWLEASERGAAVFVRANGYLPGRVSNHAVEYAWQQYSTVADCISYSYQKDGHSFIVLYFPTADATWVLDVATGYWHERGFWNTQAAKYNAHHSQNHVFVFNKHFVGDWASGNIYELADASWNGATWDFADDDGVAIRRERRSGFLSEMGRWIFVNALEIEAEMGLGSSTGQGADPQFMLRLSKDGGHSYGTELTLSAGKIGQYGLRAIWRRLGRFWGTRGMVVSVSTSDPIPWRLVAADISAS